MKMNTFISTIITAALFCTAGATVSLAEEATPSTDASVSLYSKYVWRGYELSKDSMVIQPSLSVSYKGFGANLWGNLDTNQDGMTSESFNWNETDLTLSYDGAVDKLGYSVGYIYYDLDGYEDTQELYFGLSYDTLLSPSVTIYKDIANIPGFYVSLGVSHSVPVGEQALDLGLSIGYADDDADYNALHDGLISAAMTFTINDMLSITPELYWSFALSDEAETVLETASFDGDSSFVYGGVSLSMAF